MPPEAPAATPQLLKMLETLYDAHQPDMALRVGVNVYEHSPELAQVSLDIGPAHTLIYLDPDNLRTFANMLYLAAFEVEQIQIETLVPPEGPLPVGEVGEMEPPTQETLARLFDSAQPAYEDNNLACPLNQGAQS